MADFDFLDDFTLGISAEEVANTPLTAYEKFIKEISIKLRDDFRDYIGKNAKNTGGLQASVLPVPTGKMSFRLVADDYYPFVDEGVNAVGTNNYGSRFSFQYPEVSYNMAKAISEWKGLDMEHAFAVSYNIKERGLKPKNITNNVVNDKVLERIANDLLELTGLMFEITFDKNTKTWQ